MFEGNLKYIAFDLDIIIRAYNRFFLLLEFFTTIMQNQNSLDNHFPLILKFIIPMQSSCHIALPCPACLDLP